MTKRKMNLICLLNHMLGMKSLNLLKQTRKLYFNTRFALVLNNELLQHKLEKEKKIDKLDEKLSKLRSILKANEGDEVIFN